MNKRDERIRNTSRNISFNINLLLEYTESGVYRRGYAPDENLAAAIDALMRAQDTLLYALEGDSAILEESE